jgi:hydrogenase 3 maturation protease
MQDLLNQLRTRVKRRARVCVLCIGSSLRGDDAAGLLVAKELERFVKKSRLRHVLVVAGETAPENFTGLIKKFKPKHIILIDSADAGEKTGEVFLVDPEAITGISFCTHRLPLSIMIDYLQCGMRCNVTVIGIKPGNVSFAAPVSRETKKAVRSVSSMIKQLLKGTQ